MALPGEPAVDRWSATPASRDDRPVKTSEQVAQQVVHDIVSRQLRPGDRLPGEAEMLELYGVSRESLREGLRLLETQGLISIRRGPRGGPVVGTSDPRNLGRTCALHFHFAGATYEELFRAWEMAEPLLAALAARHPDRAAVRQQLLRWSEGVAPGPEEPAAFVAVSNDFHDQVAGLADNRVLSLVLPAFTCIVADYISSSFDTVVMHEEISHDHRLIARAIVAGRPTAAQRLSEAHVRHVTDSFRARFPGNLGDIIEWR